MKWFISNKIIFIDTTLFSYYYCIPPVKDDVIHNKMFVLLLYENTHLAIYYTAKNIPSSEDKGVQANYLAVAPGKQWI